MEPKQLAPPVLDRIAWLANTQWGVVELSQLLDLGCTREQVKSMRRRGYLRPLHRRVYAVGHRVLRQEGRWLAATLATQGVLCLESAGAVLRMTADPGDTVHVLRDAVLKQRTGVTVHQTSSLPVADVWHHRGIPVTTVPRTLVDIAHARPPGQLLQAVYNTQALNLDALEQTLARAPGRRGTQPLRELTRLRGPHLRSHLEALFFRLCRTHTLERPVPQYLIDDHPADFAWPDRRLVVETDGWNHHKDRIAADHALDRRRMLLGWRTLRYPYADIAITPAAVAAELRQALGR